MEGSLVTDLDDISRILSSRQRRVTPPSGRLTAAVLLCLYGPAPDFRVIYTVRTQEVEHHKGEISFPGGVRDPEDASLVDTALRESFEEVGIAAKDVTVLGLLDDTVTISNFVVTPVVGRIELHPYEFILHEVEVGELLEVPLSHLMDPANQQHDPRNRLGQLRPTPSYRFGHHLIYGATAAMTTGFLDLLRQVRD